MNTLQMIKDRIDSADRLHQHGFQLLSTVALIQPYTALATKFTELLFIVAKAILNKDQLLGFHPAIAGSFFMF